MGKIYKLNPRFIPSEVMEKMKEICEKEFTNPHEDGNWIQAGLIAYTQIQKCVNQSTVISQKETGGFLIGWATPSGDAAIRPDLKLGKHDIHIGCIHEWVTHENLFRDRYSWTYIRSNVEVCKHCHKERLINGIERAIRRMDHGKKAI